MAFATGHLNDPVKNGPGELFGTNNDVLTSRTFENNLRAGRFAKLDAGSIDNMDGSASPALAGVVLRKIAMPVEDDNLIDNTLYGQVEYVREGFCTVRVKSGESPSMFGRVYASNAGDANDGMALASGGVATDAQFIEEVTTGAWLVHLGSPEQSPAVIADPGDAGAIPVGDSGTMAMTSAGAETRTLAIPSFAGQELHMSMNVDGGDIVVTSAQGINQAGNTSLTFDDAGDTLSLVGVTVGGALRWRVLANDGVVLA